MGKLIEEFGGNGFQLFIPGEPKTANEGFAEEAVDGELEFAAAPEGCIADGPTMEVQSDEAASEMFFAYGIECAGNGLYKGGILTLPADTFQGTETAASRELLDGIRGIIVVGEDTVFAAYDGGDEFALRVSVGHPLTINDGLCLGRHEWPSVVQQSFDFTHLVVGYGSSCIALYATGTAAGRQVTAEIFSDDGGRNQYASDVKDWDLFQV